MKIITLLRKPLEGSVAENTLKQGCGGINVDATRVGTENRINPSASENRIYGQFKGAEREGRDCVGRWPANFVLSHSEGCVLKEDVADSVCVEGCPVKQLDKQTGILVSGKDVNPTSSNVSGFFGKKDNYYSAASNYGDSGGASRFFKQFQDEE